MKKILGSLLLIFVLVSFASCKGGDKIIVDTPSDAIANALNLADVKSGDALNVDKDTQQPYFDVRVSKTISSSLFYQTINVNSYIEKEVDCINLKPLAFNQTFTQAANPTLVELINILNDKTEGISKEDLGVELLDDDYSGYLVGNMTPLNPVEIPEGIEQNPADQIQLVVVYLPIYGIYYYNADQYTNVYLMMPVYYAFTNTSKTKDYVGTVKNYQCVLEQVAQDVWVLPSKSEEK